jgi:[protein-PII] uridylyltransferase
MVVRNLRRFSVPEYAGEFPSCSHISQRLPKPELLYMAGLFHDIAKGRGGNHAELGALEVKAFCTQHRLNDYDGNLISWLVASHLVMSSTAQKQDLSDPDVIHRFAELVGDQTHLDYLYLLTVGDICGTDPKLWNAWKDTLLSDLHTKTSRALARGLTNRVNAEQHVKELQIAARALLESAGISASDIDSVWSEPDSDYFLSHTAEQIAWHTQVISKVSIDQLPLIVSRRIDATDDSEIFVFDYDRDGLFAISAIVLDYLNQNILQARLFSTRSGYSMGSYRVSGEIRNDLEKELNLTLKPRLLDPDSPLELQSRALSRTLKQFSTPTSVSYQLDEKNHRTILELVTTERRALLAMVSKIFLTRYVRLQKLSVVTVGTKAEDVFFVTDFADQPLDQPAQDSLREALIKTLDKQP